MAIAADVSKDWRYVLSAGRTGTVFLTNLIAECAPHVTALHEPSPTRYQMMLANVRNDLHFGHWLLQRTFERSRRSRLAQAPAGFVEVNPFLCPMTDLLADPERPLRVVHLVRHPGDWARSITAFKASKRYARLIDVVPFAKPFPSPRPQGWHQFVPFDKALWRWRWCNERILELRDQCAAYEVIRYEDLFTENSCLRDATLKKAFSILDIQGVGPIDSEAFSRRYNQGPLVEIEIDTEATQRICGSLANQFGYAI